MNDQGEDRIPTRDRCLRLMDEHGMLDNIVDHSLKVTEVALFLSRELNRKGQKIDLGVVEAASLLHDLAKTECLKTKEDHAEVGCERLTEMGYERIGQVVARHIVVGKPGYDSSVSEEELVNYADKRVQHDRIVSLTERFRDLRVRYGWGEVDPGAMDRMEQETYEIEQRIFSILGMDPSVLESLERRFDEEIRKRLEGR